MKRLIPVLAALAVLSCTKEIQDNVPVLPQQTLEAKLVGGGDGEIAPGSLLVKLDEASLKNASAVFSDMEVTASPAIPIRPKNMEVARKYGLHQWFTIEFDKQIRPEKMAEKMALIPAVRSVQYNRYLQPVRAEEAFPFDPVPVTKSGGLIPFDDPYNNSQWNLVNDGSVASGAVEGADVKVADAYTGAPEQLWRIEQLTDGSYRIMPKAVPGSDCRYVLASVADSTPSLVKWDFSSDNCKWIFNRK